VLDSSLYWDYSQSKRCASLQILHKGLAEEKKGMLCKINENKQILTWTSTTSAPASAIAIAIACPIPRVPPVTNAVLPVNEKREGNDVVIIAVVSVSSRKLEGP
jgi:hypothetical protein